MATTIDHLSVDHTVHVIEAFVDARDVAHRIGEQGVITAQAFNYATNEIAITWKRDGQLETMYFISTNRSGPGIGRMKQYFQLGEYVAGEIVGKRFIPNFGYVPLAPVLPQLTSTLITSDKFFDDAMNRVWALACRAQYEDAAAQLQAIVYATDRRGDNCERAAGTLCGYAKLHAFDAKLETHQWLREQGIQMWYSWGSQATSGGEGMERARHIHAAEREFADLDRKLGRSII